MAKKMSREGHARNRRHLLGEEIDQAQREQRQRDEGEADRNFRAADLKIQRHLEFALAAAACSAAPAPPTPFIAKLHITPKA